MSLAALKAAGIQCKGDEAVAIGQALCHAFKTAQLLRRIRLVTDGSNVASPVIAETVFIDVTSAVGLTVSEPRDVTTAIQSVGQILSDILPPEMRRRLDSKILSKALASPPQFGTVDELSDALAEYGRPDGRALLQAVYERWEKRAMPATAVTTADVASAAPRVPAVMRHAVSFRPGSHPIAVAGVLVAAVAFLGISGWLLLGRSGESSLGQSGSLLEGKPIGLPADANFPALKPGVGDERAHQRDSQAASQSTFTPPVIAAGAARPAPFAPAPPPTARAVRPVSVALLPSVAAAPPALLPSPTIPQPAQPWSSPMASPVAARPEAAARPASRTSNDRIPSTGPAGNDGVADTIESSPGPGKNAPARSRSVSAPAPSRTALTYDAGHADVTPPVPVLPRLLAGLQPSSPGVRLDALTIAVVVDPDGTPYSVSAVNPPQNMGEYVLLTAALSAVKGWEFSPATKDGAPVRYRLVVPLRAVTRPTP